MVTLVEVAVLAVVALLAGTLARRAVARRAAGRAASASGGAVVAVPCRARWRQGLRQRFFGYGKLGAGADGTGAVFKAPLRGAVPLPVGGRAAVRESLRPGMRVLEYRAPDGSASTSRSTTPRPGARPGCSGSRTGGPVTADP